MLSQIYIANMALSDHNELIFVEKLIDTFMYFLATEWHRVKNS